MANIRSQHVLSNITDDAEFKKSLSKYVEELHPVVNGKLEFDKNMATQTVVQYFETLGVNVGISHNLNKTGVHYWIARKSAACDIYNGTNQDTDKIVNLISSVSGVTVTLVLY